MVPTEEYTVNTYKRTLASKGGLKVLEAFADNRDLTLGDLLEGIVLHAFDGKCPFNEDSLQCIKEFKDLCDLDLDSGSCHRLIDAGAVGRRKTEKKEKTLK